MSSAKVIFVVIAAGVLFGCTPPMQPAPTSADRYQFTVNFEPNQPMKYRFRSTRNITIDWGQMPGAAGRNKETIHKATEELKLSVIYTPVDVNPFGLTTIKADCIKAEVSRDRPRNPDWKNDAAEGFLGKSWTFTIGPTGKIEDYSDMLRVIREVGQGAFRPGRGQELIKEPDMMYDFIALQWFMWDSVSSIPKPTAGVKAGEIWKSKLFVPAPMILFAARDVNYRLAEVQQQDPNNRVAVINGTYSLLYPSPPGWPVPYTQIFQMSGTFGFLRDYKVLDLQGTGQELFDIDAGRIKTYTENYTMNIVAGIPLGLGIHPKITIEQTLTMYFVPEAKNN